MKKKRAAISAWKKADKDRITGYVEKWRGLLLMNGWHINVAFAETPFQDTEKPGGVDDTVSASMNENSPYMSGHALTVYPRMLLASDTDEQERRILHEICHIILGPSKELTRRLFADKFVTWQESRDTNERATDWIANICWALRNDK